MTLHTRYILPAVAVATGCLGLSAAQADALPALPYTYYYGDTDTGLTYNRIFGSPGSFNYSGSGTDVPYEELTVVITQASFELNLIAASYPDTTMTLYVHGAFDPANAINNVVAYDDDGGSGLLSSINGTDDPYVAPGTYTLVVSGFGNGDFGTYTLEMLYASLGYSTETQLAEAMAALADAARNGLFVSGGLVRAGAKESLATRNANALAFAGGTSKLTGNVFTWLKGSALVQKDSATGREFRAPLLQVGADIGIGQNLVAGMAIGHGSLELTSTNFNFSGDQTLYQPYMAWDNGAWNGSAMLTWGQINYDEITSVGGTANVEGKLVALSAEVGRDINLEPAGTFVTPYLGVDIGEIELDATGGTLAGVGLGETVSFREITLGARLTHQFDQGQFIFGLALDHFDTDAPTNLSAGSYDPNGWSASATVDYSVTLANGLTVGAGIGFAGIHTSSVSYTGNLVIGMQF